MGTLLTWPFIICIHTDEVLHRNLSSGRGLSLLGFTNHMQFCMHPPNYNHNVRQPTLPDCLSMQSRGVEILKLCAMLQLLIFRSCNIAQKAQHDMHMSDFQRPPKE